MDEFIRRANIEHYRRLLERTTDKADRAQILKLLAEEVAKMPPPPAAGQRRALLAIEPQCQ